MSAKLLGKFKKRTEPVNYQWKFLIALPGWVVISYFAAQFVIIATLWLFNFVGFSINSILSPTVFEAFVAGLIYILTLTIAMGVPYLILKRKTTLQTLGLSRLATWTDIGLAPLAFIVYALALAGVLFLVVQFFPGFQADQAQEIGFKSISRQYEFSLAFLTLVVIGPIAEEALFRGYLYGKLRSHVPMYAAIIATSLLFALAHGQWNVAIDTFLLSVVMCGLREVTGSIWAGILVHMLKNMIAFYWLFLSPVLMLGS